MSEDRPPPLPGGPRAAPSGNDYAREMPEQRPVPPKGGPDTGPITGPDTGLDTGPIAAPGAGSVRPLEGGLFAPPDTAPIPASPQLPLGTAPPPAVLPADKPPWDPPHESVPPGIVLPEPDWRPVSSIVDRSVRRPSRPTAVPPPPMSGLPASAPSVPSQPPTPPGGSGPVPPGSWPDTHLGAADVRPAPDPSAPRDVPHHQPPPGGASVASSTPVPLPDAAARTTIALAMVCALLFVVIAGTAVWWTRQDQDRSRQIAQLTAEHEQVVADNQVAAAQAKAQFDDLGVPERWNAVVAANEKYSGVEARFNQAYPSSQKTIPLAAGFALVDAVRTCLVPVVEYNRAAVRFGDEVRGRLPAEVDMTSAPTACNVIGWGPPS